MAALDVGTRERAQGDARKLVCGREVEVSSSEVCRGSAASDAGDDASASAHVHITTTLRHATWSIACESLQLLSRADHAPLQRAHAPARH